MMDPLSRERLIDTMVEAYVDWRQACIEVSEAYQTWTSEIGRGGRVAFDRYTAALDAEERAAERSERLVQYANALVWRDAAVAGPPASEWRVERP